MSRTTARLARLAGGLIAGAVVLAGCSAGNGAGPDGGRSSGAAAQPQDVNDADVAFAQGMIPHHEGALMMAGVAAERAEHPGVRELAERIEAGQDPEIDLMTGWLEDWGRPIDHGAMDGMDHGPRDMGGMDPEDMPAAGTDFDTTWLRAMIEHHDGAVVMAGIEIDDGVNPDAIALAEQIVETQTREIDEMQRLLDELGG